MRMREPYADFTVAFNEQRSPFSEPWIMHARCRIAYGCKARSLDPNLHLIPGRCKMDMKGARGLKGERVRSKGTLPVQCRSTETLPVPKLLMPKLVRRPKLGHVSGLCLMNFTRVREVKFGTGIRRPLTSSFE